MEDANIPIEKMRPFVKDLVFETITQLTNGEGIKVSDYSLAMRMVRVEEELKSLREIQTAMLREMTARFEAMDKRFEALQREMDKRFEAVDKRFEAVDKRFESMDKRFEAVDKRFEAVDKRFEAVDKRFNSLQWMMGIGFTAVIALLITILRLTI